MSFDRTMNRRHVVKSSVGIVGGAALAASNLAARPASAQEEQVELTFMYWGDTNERDILQDSMRAFEELHPHIAINGTHLPVDYNTRLQTLAAANELPDVFPMNAGLSFEWALQGLIMDLTPYVEQYPQLHNRMGETFYYSAPGRTHGTMNAVECALLFYNKELLEEADVPHPPANASDAYTWDEFVETAQQLTLDSSGRNATDSNFDAGNIRQYGCTFPKWWFVWWGLLKSNGGDIATEDGMQYALNNPEAVEVFQRLQDLIHVHHVSPTPTQETNLAAPSVQLQSRRVAMLMHGQWNCQSLAESEVPFGIGVLPRFEVPATIIDGSPTVINATTEHPEEALDFLLFYNDPENAIQLYSGGLMMPLDEKYYTDPEFIARWTGTPARPPEYEQAAIDYIWNHSVVSPVNFKNFSAIDSRIAGGMDPIWSGEQSAEEALNALEETIQPLLEGKYPTS